MSIVFDNICKKFQLNDLEKYMTVLDHVSFNVDENEFICLLGPSGCGKSTLLKMLAGLENIDEGVINVDGNEVKGPNPERGMVFQDYALFHWLTVEKNIAFGLELKGVPKEVRKQKVDECIELVGLKGFENAYPHQLSGGMKQRVAIARVLAMKPKMMLMDEPFSALDAFTRMNMQDELMSLWQKQRFTCIFVTHDIEEAVYMADKIVVMNSRPGKVKTIVSVPLARPRKRTDYDFIKIRNHVFEQYGYQQSEDIDYSI